MGNFVGRKEELKYLNEVYGRTPVSCAVCGRRHLGKTSVIKQFCQDKKFLYLHGISGLKEDNLRILSESLSKFAGKRIVLEDIIDLFPAVKSVCGKKKIVVIINDYADLVENFPEFNAYLRGFMNRDLNSTNIMLLVCDTDSSIFGRFYYTLDVRCMNYLECKGFHPGYTPLQHLVVFSVIGGTPVYQQLFMGDPYRIIRNEFFDHMSLLTLEAESLISAEAVIRTACVKVLSAMANGAESVKDIASKSGLSSSVCTKMLEDMEHKGILRKETSFGLTRRTVYSFNSNIVRFTYEVVKKYSHMLDYMTPGEVYDIAKPDIDAYMERGFKFICADFITLKYNYSFVGKLRKKDDTLDTRVDIVASIKENNVSRSVYAICRLYGEPMGMEEYTALKNTARRIEGANKMYMIFSGCGFTNELREEAEKDLNLRIYSLDEVYRG